MAKQSPSATPAAAPAPLPRLVFFLDLKPRFGIKWSRVHIRRLERAGKFPSRFYPVGGNCAWMESDIVRWIESRREQTQSRPVPSHPAHSMGAGTRA